MEEEDDKFDKLAEEEAEKAKAEELRKAQKEVEAANQWASEGMSDKEEDQLAGEWSCGKYGYEEGSLSCTLAVKTPAGIHSGYQSVSDFIVNSGPWLWLSGKVGGVQEWVYLTSHCFLERNSNLFGEGWMPVTEKMKCGGGGERVEGGAGPPSTEVVYLGEGVKEEDLAE